MFILKLWKAVVKMTYLKNNTKHSHIRVWLRLNSPVPDTVHNCTLYTAETKYWKSHHFADLPHSSSVCGLSKTLLFTQLMKVP